MASWIVMEPPRDGRTDSGDLAFVRDGFSFLAFLFPPLWLLGHRLWIEAMVTFAVLFVIAGLDRGAGMTLAPLLSLLVSIYVGLEGSGLHVAALKRRGWNFLAVVEAEDLYDAETRYAEGADEDGDGIPDRYQIVPSVSPAGTAPARSVGLLLNPGR